MGAVGDPRSCVAPASLAAVGLRLSNRQHSRRDSTLPLTNGAPLEAGPTPRRGAGLQPAPVPLADTFPDSSSFLFLHLHLLSSSSSSLSSLSSLLSSSSSSSSSCFIFPPEYLGNELCRVENPADRCISPQRYSAPCTARIGPLCPSRRHSDAHNCSQDRPDQFHQSWKNPKNQINK